MDAADILRTGYAALNDGDIAGALAFLDPEAEIHVAREDGGVSGLDWEPVYRGIEGFGRWYTQVREVWDDARYEPETFEELGPGLVLLKVLVTGRGRGSGIEVEAVQFHLCRVAGGRLRELRSFLSRDEALAAAGT